MISREDVNGVAVLTIEHGKANAIDTDLLDALADRLDSLETSDAEALVLTGSGASFSAGVDLFKVMDGGVDYLESFLPALSKSVRRLFAFPKPVVAALNGHAIAGGCILAAACDHRIMAEGRGKVGVTELLVGVPFPIVALEVLRFLLPAARLQALIYDGRLSGPEEALRIGWVDEVVEADGLRDRALAVAGKWAGLSDSAFAMTKRQLRAGALARMDESGDLDEEIRKVWEDPRTLARIRAFMGATVGRKS